MANPANINKRQIQV